MIKRVIFIILPAILGSLLLMLAGCGVSSKSKVRVGAPKAKAGKRIPGSQRPYTINGRTYYPIPSAHGFSEEGIASWYGRKFHGRKTASGERYDMYAMTAAHKTLPLGTHVRVTNLKNGKKIEVRVNDRGPFVRGRIIDLSFTAAKKLGVAGPGTAPVRVEALGQSLKEEDIGTPRVPGKPPPVFKMGPFGVQVGAFSVKANAVRLAKKLSAQYPAAKAVVVPYDDGERLLHRVRVFSLPTEEEAQQKLEQLAADGYGWGFVVALD